MKLLTFKMEITGEKDGFFFHRVNYQGEQAAFVYHPGKASLQIEAEGRVSEIISRNRDQLLKILRTKKPASFFKGFRLAFVLTDGKDVGIFDDINKVIVVDCRKNEDEINVVDIREARQKEFEHLDEYMNLMRLIN